LIHKYLCTWVGRPNSQPFHWPIVSVWPSGRPTGLLIIC